MSATETNGSEVAEAWLLNSSNRGIFERLRDVSARAGAPEPDLAAAVAFVLEGDFARQAEADLADVAARWEPHVEAPPARILDAGCGPGASTLALARRYPAASIVGLDVEAPAVALAQHLTGGLDCEIRLESIEGFEATEGFDLIQCRMVLEHVYDPRRSLQKLASLLRPGGAAYVETPNYLFPWEPHVRLPMLPRSPKPILRAECRLTGRDPEFVGHLNFECGRARFVRWVRETAPDVEVVDLMAAKVREVLDPDSARLPQVRGRARVVARIKRHRTAAAAATFAIARLGIAPSVQLLLVRRASSR